TTALARAQLAPANTRFVIVHPTPGHEEQVLAGIAATVPGTAVAIGGTAADDDLSGRWLCDVNYTLPLTTTTSPHRGSVLSL
ncbi:MAG: hypothetical protein ACK53W_04850, partial [Gemmatimonadota bacterium]